MDEIINAVVAKTGLSHDIAKVAVVAVLSHIKAHLPKVIADQIDSYLGTGAIGATTTGADQAAGGHPSGADVMGSVLKGLGGILGQK